MRKQYKIKRYTALFICAAFVLRLIFINAGWQSSSVQSLGSTSKNINSSLKTKSWAQAYLTSKINYSPLAETEFCEEADNLEELESKITPVQLDLLSFSFLSNDFPSKLSNFHFYDLNLTKPSNSIYKNIQVFRI